MADNNQVSKSLRKPRMRKTETVRERAQKAASPKSENANRVHKRVGRKIQAPIKKAAVYGRKEYYPLRVRGTNRVSNFLNKKRGFTPGYFKAAYAELKQVIWPTTRMTLKLTWAVFMFATIFGIIVAITDYGLENLFKRILL